MSSAQEGMDTGSSGVSRRVKKHDRNRRSWTEREESTLIAAIKELIVEGWKNDNGFRPGYLNKLEEALRKEFPHSDLKGNPHINSKLCAWKKNYYSLTGILSRSGIGFNANGNRKIDCEDDQWEQIIKLDPNVRLMRYKSFPHYEVWKEIFGNDRATGEAAEDVADAWTDMRGVNSSPIGGTGGFRDVSLEDINENLGSEDNASQSQKPSPKQTLKRKKSKVSEDTQAVCDVLLEMGRKTDARLVSIAERIGAEFNIWNAKKMAFEQLGIMSGLSLDQQFDVSEILAKNIDKLEVFSNLADSAKLSYVQRLLSTQGK